MLDISSSESVPDETAEAALTKKPQKTLGKRGSKSEDRYRVEHGVTIYRVPSKSPTWYIQYSNGGRQIRTSLKTTIKRQAIELAQVRSRERHAGRIGPSDGKKLQIETLIKEYLNAVTSKGLSPATVACYRSKLEVFEAFCLEEGVRHLARLDASLMARFQARLETKGYVPPSKRTGKKARGGPHKRSGQKPRTIRDKLKMIRQLCLFAVRRKYIQLDPTEGFDIPRAPSDRAHCWSPEEADRVLAQVPADLLAVFRFYALTGLRAEELCWLTKADLTSDSVGVGSIHIRVKSCPLTGEAWQPKHRRERVVPLAPEAIEIARQAAAASKCCWLFEAPATANGDGRWSQHRLWKTVKRAMTAAGVTKGTLHTFRHFCCTRLSEAGVPPISISQFMGHNDLKMVQHYSHPSASHLSAAVANLSLAPTQPAAKEPGGDLAEK